MSNFLPKRVIEQLQHDHNDILNSLEREGYKIPTLPKRIKGQNEEGETFSIAYSIQGILKYHGLADKNHRIAYFPSISLNNSSSFTVSFLKFDKNLSKDRAVINGEEVKDQRLLRVKSTLDSIREYSKIKTKAILISKNIMKGGLDSEILTDRIKTKGLGTSASASAALALGALSIIYGNNKDYTENARLKSIFSRYLAGSGSRSAVGGLALWLSHPKMNPFESYAIRLDEVEDQDWLSEIDLITIPISSDIITDSAHELAPYSPFYISWAKNRRNQIIEFLRALKNHNWRKIGELAELDSICLHSITMTSSKSSKNRLIAWEPDTLKIIKHINELKDVYYTIDTGPSVVLITHKDNTSLIIDEVRNINSKFKIFMGKIAGPSRTLKPDSLEAKFLEKDIDKFL